MSDYYSSLAHILRTANAENEPVISSARWAVENGISAIGKLMIYVDHNEITSGDMFDLGHLLTMLGESLNVLENLEVRTQDAATPPCTCTQRPITDDVNIAKARELVAKAVEVDELKIYDNRPLISQAVELLHPLNTKDAVRACTYLQSALNVAPPDLNAGRQLLKRAAETLTEAVIPN